MYVAWYKDPAVSLLKPIGCPVSLIAFDRAYIHRAFIAAASSAERGLLLPLPRAP